MANFNKQAATVVSGFPGIGKSHFFNRQQELGLKVMDSDSSKFPKDNFPQNYMQHIGEAMYQCDYLLVSSHDAVRRALVDAGVVYTLVYPHISLKDEYMRRYKERGSPQPFLDLMEKNWDSFVTGCINQTGCKHVVLQAGQYMSDVIG